MWQIKDVKFAVAYSFLDCQKSANGMAKYIMTQQDQFLNRGASYIYIYSIKKTIMNDRMILFCKYGVVIDDKYVGVFSIEEVLKNISILIKNGKEMCSLHLHHLMYSKLDDIYALTELVSPAKIYVYLHDFYTQCINFNLLRNKESFCGKGAISKEKCTGCISYKLALEIIPNIQAFLEKISERLVVISPSESTASIWLSAYSQFEQSIRIVPHKIFIGESMEKKRYQHSEIRMAFLGRPVKHKGWDQWCSLVEKYGCDKRFKFYVLGNVDVTNKDMVFYSVSVTKGNPNDMVNALVDNEIDVCFIWALWPETYSYTCIESVEAGTFIFTNSDSGNIADVVNKNRNGIIFNSFDKVIEILGKADQDLFSLLEKYSHTEASCIKKSKDNNEIVEECINDDLNANINTTNYRRIDLMPKVVLKLLRS